MRMLLGAGPMGLKSGTNLGTVHHRNIIHSAYALRSGAILMRNPHRPRVNWMYPVTVLDRPKVTRINS